MNNFTHSQFAHCESGVLSTLLTQSGLALSEEMVFGITSSLSFVYLPFIKINNLPLVSYRQMPKNMVKNLPKILNIKMFTKRYKEPNKARYDLDKYLHEGKLVGLQTSVFYLPYFPKDMRFHFNAHNLIVLKKQGDSYLISDPVFEDITICDALSLQKARFAKGVFAPKGFLYFPKNIPEHIDFKALIKKAIVKNAKQMLTPFPYAGVKGMRKLAQKISTFDKKTDHRYLKNFLTHIVRMQEEIGTGGGGFRFLYASFLQEAKAYGLDEEKLLKCSDLLIDSGDKFREFALLCVKFCKNIDEFNAKDLSLMLEKISNIEESVFKNLKTL